jgi:single-stranded DNA-binding protein
MINKVEVEGIMHANPQAVTTSKNVPLCKLFLRHVKTYTNKFKSGEKISYVPVTTWGPLAQECQNLKKDDTVKVEGILEFQTWEVNGEKKGQLVVTASSVTKI